MNIRPRLRNTLATALVDINGCLQSCVSCEFFAEATEICQKYSMRPPARVIAFGCPSYSDKQDTPF